jgi:hypothetical protein
MERSQRDDAATGYAARNLHNEYGGATGSRTPGKRSLTGLSGPPRGGPGFSGALADGPEDDGLGDIAYDKRGP